MSPMSSQITSLFTQSFIQTQIKKTLPKLRVTGLCEGNSSGTGEFPSQRASNAENVSIDDVIVDRVLTRSELVWCHQLHWNENVIVTKMSSLTVLEVVILTSSSAASYKWQFHQNEDMSVSLILVFVQTLMDKVLHNLGKEVFTHGAWSPLA